MAVIPVKTDEVLKTLNLSDLSGKQRIADLFRKWEEPVLLYIKKNVTETSYKDVTSGTPDDDETVAFTIAYSYIMFSKIIEFLNLNTVGEGIIESTGIDERKTQLLGTDSIEKKKRGLELSGLRYLRTYLNETGEKRLSELSKKKIHGMKSALLYNTDDEDNWWENE